MLLDPAVERLFQLSRKGKHIKLILFLSNLRSSRSFCAGWKHSFSFLLYINLISLPLKGKQELYFYLSEIFSLQKGMCKNPVWFSVMHSQEKLGNLRSVLTTCSFSIAGWEHHHGFNFLLQRLLLLSGHVGPSRARSSAVTDTCYGTPAQMRAWMQLLMPSSKWKFKILMKGIRIFYCYLTLECWTVIIFFFSGPSGPGDRWSVISWLCYQCNTHTTNSLQSLISCDPPHSEKPFQSGTNI